MKIQCDVCERNEASVICCADEAALCAKCDTQVHAANKLAKKHQRLELNSFSSKLPTCDICQEKAAFIFCVEDRALYCQDCDESIHAASTLAANHQRYLTTGIQVALSLSKCRNDSEKICKEPSNQNAQQISVKQTIQQPLNFSPPASWAVEDLLKLSEFDSSNKKGDIGLGEFDWWSDVNLFGEQLPHEALAAAEVPELPMTLPSNRTIQYRPTKISISMPNKKPRIEFPLDDEGEYSIVPDLG